MIVVDTSALIAILLEEPDWRELLAVIAMPGAKAMSAASYFEACTVADKTPGLSELFDRMFEKMGIELVPLSPAHAQIARQTHRKYGKGSGHKARLNFGDCFAYALAKQMKAPLLFKGANFAATDVKRAV